MSTEIRRLLAHTHDMANHLRVMEMELEALLSRASPCPPTEEAQELADLESLPMYGATHEAQYDKAYARVQALRQKLDPLQHVAGHPSPEVQKDEV